METKLGPDFPADFLDPIAYCLMRDPVKLPTSNNTMEKSVIKRILLNDEHDPFNRAPLSPGDLVPDVELKARVDKWI